MAKLISDGAIGKLFYFKYRAAHNGPKEIGCSKYFYEWLYDEEKNGAGAFMDYCCYAANMMAYFLGMPQSVFGFRGIFAKDYPLPDDNAILVAKYPHAFGVAEACWTEVTGKQALPNPVAYGTEGCISLQSHSLVVQRGKADPETVAPTPLWAPDRHAPEYLIHCIENNVEPEGMCSMRVSRDAQEILEAGLVSSNTGRAVNWPAE
jgi:predicted dehydrogenase